MRFCRTPERKERLWRFSKDMEHRDYEHNFSEIFNAFIQKDQPADLSSVFCSELVAEALQQIGVLKPGRASNSFLPSDFVAKGASRLLAPGCSFGPNLSVDFSDTDLAYTERALESMMQQALHEEQVRASAQRKKMKVLHTVRSVSRLQLALRRGTPAAATAEAEVAAAAVADPATPPTPLAVCAPELPKYATSASGGSGLRPNWTCSNCLHSNVLSDKACRGWLKSGRCQKPRPVRQVGTCCDVLLAVRSAPLQPPHPDPASAPTATAPVCRWPGEETNYAHCARAQLPRNESVAGSHSPTLCVHRWKREEGCAGATGTSSLLPSRCARSLGR